MSNITQLFDPKGYIILLKFETILEKQLTKLQKLTLYNTSLKFICVIAKVSLTHVCLIFLKQLDPRVEKKEGILPKRQTNFLCFRTILF